MNDPDLFERNGAANLSRLNESERRILRMLAEGHTAKTVATELETSPAAVNERLREARRKTGVGSSRELARLLKAQENCDEIIGVGKPRNVGALEPRPDAERRRPHTGVIAMIGLFLVAASAATLMSQVPQATNEVDPLLGRPLTTSPDPAALHAKVRSEPREAAWAAKMEDAVRARLLQIPLIGNAGNVLRVTCATDLCEIGGTIHWPYPREKEFDPKLPESRAQAALQEKELHDDLAKLGLKSEASLFMGAAGKPERIAFLLYYSRAK